MKMLAIDTSSKRCSVCILENNNVLINLYNDDEKTHSVKLMPMIDKAFYRTGLTLNDISYLSCCVGPGSFTGVRIGIATIKAFADVKNIPVIGVSSLETLAYNVKDLALESNSLICSKTPIAAMHLLLQGDDTERGRELSAELFKIEQYVEMVLQYLRLGSDTTDYLIREVPLEQIVRQAVRKYAQLFIHSRVSLDLQPLSLRVLTDEKWLGFVVEQVLSNAVKYARGGTVRIFAQGDTLVIQDNGIGIAPEDLPRVFENGYTGCNGRTDKRSTGIGLYLCRQICDRLGHRISLSSQVGKGTEVRIELGRSDLEVE